jgi:hypothetical protein
MKKLQLLCWCLGFLGMAPLSKAAFFPTVYVWTFMNRDRTVDEHTWSLTEEFDNALVNSGKYNVLERRAKDKLDEQAKIEAGIDNTAGISGKIKSAIESADMVIFGEVYEDDRSRVYTVTVTFEDWHGEKRLVKEVDIPRDDIGDVSKRRAAMEQLVQKINGATAPVLKAESHSFLVEITKCQAQGEEVTVEMSICNNDDIDRRLALSAGRGVLDFTSTMLDNNGNEMTAYYVRISNHESDGVVGSMMAAGIPVKCVLGFRGVPKSATTLARLNVGMASGDQKFGVTFKNIIIDRGD